MAAGAVPRWGGVRVVPPKPKPRREEEAKEEAEARGEGPFQGRRRDVDMLPVCCSGSCCWEEASRGGERGVTMLRACGGVWGVGWVCGCTGPSPPRIQFWRSSAVVLERRAAGGQGHV